jgi:hypothetical protein
MAKADKALAARRLDDILRIRLDGAQWWDVREFVREKEKEEGSAWHVGPDGKPLSDAMIRKYQERADKLVYESHEKSRKKLFRRHLAQRRNLYARATTAGDIRTALACLDSEADLLGLYPPRKVAPTTPDGNKPYEPGTGQLGAIVAELRAAVERHGQGPGGEAGGCAGGDGPAPVETPGGPADAGLPAPG